MRTRFAAPIALAAVAAVVGLTTSCSASDEPSTATTTTATQAPAATTTDAATSTTAASTATDTAANQVISVTVAGGQVTPPPADVPVKLGSTVTIMVTSDVDDEVHVHGYDQSVELHAGHAEQLQLTANIPGEFDVELEQKHLQLFTLQVS